MPVLFLGCVRARQKMQLNEVRTPTDADYDHVRQLCCDETPGWTVAYAAKKLQLTVWTKPSKQTDFNKIKASITFDDVPASTVYDVLHDSEFRSNWDKYMLTSQDLGLLNPISDIEYYAIKSVPPLKNRDLVLQRSWLDLGNEMIIFSHSVCHDDFPPRPGLVRATTYLTGYVIRATSSKSCIVNYMTHADPGGRMPSWLVNRMTQVVAPKAMKRLHRACLEYPKWKSKNNANWKPWMIPDQQMDLPRVDVRKCKPRVYAIDRIDESRTSELENNDVED